MYPKVKDNLLDGINVDKTVSAMLSNGFIESIGTQCLLDFSTVVDRYTGDPLKEQQQNLLDDAFKRKDKYNKLNELIYNDSVTAQINVKYPFPSNSRTNIIRHESQALSDFYCTKINPIILDTFQSKIISKIESISSEKDIFSLPKKIDIELDKNRYLNYVLNDICKSKAKLLESYLNDLYIAFDKEYKQHICTYIKGNGQATLLDTMSISFYKLKDIIPIFDYRKSNGIAIEFLLTNSTYNFNDMAYSKSNYIIVRWLFSKYRDNLFTIDGELIKRSFECSIHDSLASMSILLHKYTPNDAVIKKKINSKSMEKGE